MSAAYLALVAAAALTPVQFAPQGDGRIPELQASETAPCVLYTNNLQPGVQDELVTIDVQDFEVTFHFMREFGDEPDTVEVWEVSEGYVADKQSLTLNEFESGWFCFKPYEGS